MPTSVAVHKCVNANRTQSHFHECGAAGWCIMLWHRIPGMGVWAAPRWFMGPNHLPKSPPDGPHNSPADSPPDSRADSPQTAPRQPTKPPFTKTPS